MNVEGLLWGDNSQNIAFSHDHEFLIVESDLRSRVFSVQNSVSNFDSHVNLGTVLNTAGPNGLDGAPLGFFLCRVWNVKAACCLLFRVLRLHDHAITKWLNVHGKKVS